jgi:hypothetical protein
MTISKRFGTFIVLGGAVGLFAPSAGAQSVSTGIFGGGLARQVLEQQDAERHKAEKPSSHTRPSQGERTIRGYEAQREAAAAAARARAARIDPAQTTKPVAPAAAMTKLDGKLPSDSATTAEISKTDSATIVAPAAAMAKLDGKLPSDSATTAEIPKTPNEATAIPETAETSASDSNAEVTASSPCTLDAPCE